MQIHINCYQYTKLLSKSVKPKEDEKLFNITSEKVENNKEVVLGTDEEEKRAELENISAELSSANYEIKSYLLQLTKNQQAAQISGSAFVKMITTTTSVAGHEICDNFFNLINSHIMSGKFNLDEIKSIADEAICKMEIQYKLSIAALQANSILEEMKAAGVDDSEIRELFENYGNNMDTSIGQTKSNKQNNDNIKIGKKGKNISKTASNNDVENKITELKKKIQEEKAKLKNKNLPLQERIQTEVKLNGHIFLIDMYKSIKESMQALNQDLWSKITSLLN